MLPIGVSTINWLWERVVQIELFQSTYYLKALPKRHGLFPDPRALL
jgi:hypothetical protein